MLWASDIRCHDPQVACVEKSVRKVCFVHTSWDVLFYSTVHPNFGDSFAGSKLRGSAILLWGGDSFSLNNNENVVVSPGAVAWSM